jgi:hypothetical protein
MRKWVRKMHPATVGLLQALGVGVYVVLISAFFHLIERSEITPPGGFGTMIAILLLLVFSAAVTGSLIFGYPTYLIINKGLNRALQVLLYTSLFLLVTIIVALLIVFV